MEIPVCMSATTVHVVLLKSQPTRLFPYSMPYVSRYRLFHVTSHEAAFFVSPHLSTFFTYQPSDQSLTDLTPRFSLTHSVTRVCIYIHRCIYNLRYTSSHPSKKSHTYKISTLLSLNFCFFVKKYSESFY